MRPFDAQELTGRACFLTCWKGETCACTQQGHACEPRLPVCAASQLTLLCSGSTLRKQSIQHMQNSVLSLVDACPGLAINSLGTGNCILCLLSFHRPGEKCDI